MPVIGFLHNQSPDALAERLRGLSPRPQGYRLRRGRERRNRLPLGREPKRSAAGAGGRSGAPTGCRDRRDRPACGACGQSGYHNDPHRFRRPRRPGPAWSCREPLPAGKQRTGINFFVAELIAKRLELLRELVPTAVRVAVLVNPDDTQITPLILRDVEAAARAMGLQIQIVRASTSREINAAFASFARERPDALFLGADPFFTSPANAIDPPGVTSCNPRGIFGARLCRSGRADELRNQRDGCVASGRRLCRPHPQGRQARRSAGRAVNQIRAGHQRARPPRCSASRCRRRCSPRADEVIE